MEGYQEVTPQISPFGFTRKTRGKGRGSNRPPIPMTQMDTSETNTNSHMSTNSPSANAYNILNETAHQDVNYNPLSHLTTAECEDFLRNDSTNYGQPDTQGMPTNYASAIPIPPWPSTTPGTTTASTPRCKQGSENDDDTRHYSTIGGSVDLIVRHRGADTNPMNFVNGGGL